MYVWSHCLIDYKLVNNLSVILKIKMDYKDWMVFDVGHILHSKNKGSNTLNHICNEMRTAWLNYMYVQGNESTTFIQKHTFYIIWVSGLWNDSIMKFIYKSNWIINSRKTNFQFFTYHLQYVRTIEEYFNNLLYSAACDCSCDAKN
jgi:hypothetical protein